MESDGPVSAVQVRLAKGEISTAQYKEILGNLMKNVSSFQQTSSLKIIQMRYAKSEITAEQYQENYTNLMKNLYSQPWSPPLHILHVRYAEGELDTVQYEEMFTNLTQEQFAYDQSTPLWILNNRYAKGELTTGEYEEILSLFNDYSLTLQQSAMKVPSDLQAQFQNQEKKNVSAAQKKPESLPPSERSSLNLKTSQIYPSAVSDTIAIQSDSDLHAYDHFNDQPIRATQSTINTEELPDQTVSDVLEIQSDISTSTKTDSPVSADLKAVDTSVLEFGETVDSSSESEPVANAGSQTVSSGKKEMSPELMSIPELKTGAALGSDIHSFPSTLTHISGSGNESLPSDFLSLGMKQGSLGMTGSDDSPVASADHHARADYSIAKVSSSGEKGNTYETVTSKITPLTDAAGLMEIIPVENLDSPLSDEKGVADFSDIRQKIKTLIVKGNYQEAVALAETMIGADDNDYLPHFYKGMARYYLNVHDEALADLDHARELCKNKDEIRKIDTIRNHILSKQKKEAEAGEIHLPDGENQASDEQSSDLAASVPEGADALSANLDALGKKAQDLIDKKDFKAANKVLTEFIGLCSGLSKERLLAESVDEIYAAMGYVRYQLKDYSHAKEFFQDALGINAENEVANNYMKDILIRAARKK